MSKHRAKASKQGREEVARGRWGTGGGGGERGLGC